MFKRYLTLTLLSCAVQLASAQKTITLSDSLSAHADLLTATIDKSGWGSKFPKLSFGDYSVVSGKWDLPGYTQTSNILGTKTDTKSSRKFSFLMTDKANDSVKVSGVMKLSSENKIPLQIVKSVFYGTVQQLAWLDFSATIAVSGDSSRVWTLTMKTESGGETGQYTALLTDGKRNIQIIPVGVAYYALPAFGYEFIDGDRFLSAYQFAGKSRSFQSLYKVYIEKSLDVKVKTALSGAMVALMGLKD